MVLKLPIKIFVILWIISLRQITKDKFYQQLKRKGNLQSTLELTSIETGNKKKNVCLMANKLFIKKKIKRRTINKNWEHTRIVISYNISQLQIKLCLICSY